MRKGGGEDGSALKACPQWIWMVIHQFILSTLLLCQKGKKGKRKKGKKRHIKLGLCHSFNTAISPEDYAPNRDSKLMNINHFPECNAARQTIRLGESAMLNLWIMGEVKDRAPTKVRLTAGGRGLWGGGGQIQICKVAEKHLGPSRSKRKGV